MSSDEDLQSLIPEPTGPTKQRTILMSALGGRGKRGGAKKGTRGRKKVDRAKPISLETEQLLEFGRESSGTEKPTVAPTISVADMEVDSTLPPTLKLEATLAEDTADTKVKRGASTRRGRGRGGRKASSRSMIKEEQSDLKEESPDLPILTSPKDITKDGQSDSTSGRRGRKKVSRAKPVSQEAELDRESSETEKPTVAPTISVADMEVDSTLPPTLKLETTLAEEDSTADTKGQKVRRGASSRRGRGRGGKKASSRSVNKDKSIEQSHDLEEESPDVATPKDAKDDQSDSTSGQSSGSASQSGLNKRGRGKASTPRSKKESELTAHSVYECKNSPLTFPHRYLCPPYPTHQ